MKGGIKLKKIKPWFFAIGLVVFLMVFMIGRKAYGNMAMQGNKPAGETIELGDGKMDETLTGSDTATDTTINTIIENSEPESSESDEAKVEYVDEKMNEALTSDEYSKMSLTEREELASGILSQLEQDGYITGLLYDENSYTYSFEYIDGTLGGWRIKDFSAQDGLLPIN